MLKVFRLHGWDCSSIIMATPTITPGDVSTPQVVYTGITSTMAVGGPSSVGDSTSGVNQIPGAPGAPNDALTTGIDVSLIPTAYALGPAPAAGNPQSSGNSTVSTTAGAGGGTGAAGGCDSTAAETLKDLLTGGWSNLSSCEKQKIYLWALIFVVVLVLLRITSKASKGIL